MIKNWLENKEHCKKLCLENPKLVSQKENNKNFKGDYITWTLVWKWMIKHFDFTFNVLEAKTSQDGSNGFVRAEINIVKEYIYDKDKKLIETNEVNENQTLCLTLETFKRFIKDKDGKYILDKEGNKTFEYYQESPEQLQMRVFVKMVANLTGFGFHLWEK